LATRRIGIFGGTFDPPHLGHLLLAETIREQFALDEILFVPSHQPPHKQREDMTSPAHRYALVVAATLHNPAFSPSAIEVNRPGRSFSIDTVRELREHGDAATELFFVAGLDSFLQIETWKDYEELLDSCDFIVVSRPNNSFERIHGVLPERFHDRIVDVRGRTNGVEPAVDRADSTPRIYLSDAVYLDVSATGIRSRVRAGRTVRYRVTPEVERYLQTHGLYREPAAAAEAVT